MRRLLRITSDDEGEIGLFITRTEIDKELLKKIVDEVNYDFENTNDDWQDLIRLAFRKWDIEIEPYILIEVEG